MARITDEQKEQINELYAEIGVMSRVAKIVGVSAASVKKYLIEGYIPKSQRKEILPFTREPAPFPEYILNMKDKYAVAAELIQLTEEEKEDLKELQKEILL